MISICLPTFSPALIIYLNHHTWQAGELSWRTTANKLVWPSITWSGDYLTNDKTLYFYFHEAYGYQTWQGGSYWWKDVIHKVTWNVDHVDTSDHMTNKECYVSYSKRYGATKLDKMVACDKEPQTSKLHLSPIA